MHSIANTASSLSASEPSPIRNLDPETIRMKLERPLIERYSQDPASLRWLIPPDPSKVRRHLMARALRVTEAMAKGAYERARLAASILGVEHDIEIYQSSGPENAQIHLVKEPVLLELQGRLLPLLDEGAALALFGHELGHYLAHGPTSDAGTVAYIARKILHGGRTNDAAYREAQLHCLAAELTADRFGLLAAQDLQAALRLEMVAATGLSADMLTLDTEAYLAQCISLCESLLEEGEVALGSTHPEHSVRAYALWLFSETDVYQELTGQGSGNRSLKDVEAILEQLLSTARSESDPSAREEPPRELHECALAGSALVALADGELADEETEAIERIFAPLVPEWSEYLDLDIATERFFETAPLIASGGSLMRRSLFHLLFHVMIADKEISRSELQMIVAIGDVIGAGGIYRRWLDEGLRAIGQNIDPRDFESEEPPIPVQAEQVAVALDAFITCVKRRGHGQATVRRLLRILGLEERLESIDEAGRTLEQRLIDANLSYAPSFDELARDDASSLDETIAFRFEGQGQSDDASAPRAKESLEFAVQRLRDSLVSGDGRSPSVRLRKLRSGRNFDIVSLDRIVVGRSERVLAQVQSGQAAVLLNGSEVGERRDAKELVRELVALERENKAREEETGANDLFLGTPFVIGSIRAERQTISAGYAVRAPLLLHRVKLVRKGGGELAYSLTPIKDEPPIVNQSLMRLIFNKLNMTYGDELAEELDLLADSGGLEAVLDRLGEAGVVIQRERDALIPFENRDEELEERDAFLDLEPVAILGLFPQSSSDLLQDYDSLLVDLAEGKRPLNELLASASALLPTDLRPEMAKREAAASAHPIVPADPSQLAILRAAQESRALVVDGPPGSGKSQVIVNLVADALSRGERVAVVCEKRAAIDVVAQRLEAAGLGEALALVHDVKDDRKALFERVKRRLSTTAQRSFAQADYDEARERAQRLDEELNRLPALLRGESSEPNLCIGELATLASIAPDAARLERLELSRLHADEFARWREDACELWEYRELWNQGSYWARLRRASFGRMSHEEQLALLGAIRESIDAAKELELARAAADLEGPLPPSLGPLIMELAEALAHDRDETQLTALSKLLEARLAGRIVSAAGLSNETRIWKESAETSLRLASPIRQEAPALLPTSAHLLLASSSSFFRFFSFAWWKARSAVRQGLASFWTEKVSARLDASFLNELVSRLRSNGGWKAIDAVYERLNLPLASHAERADRVASELERSAVWIDRLADDLPALREVGASPSLPLGHTSYQQFKERISILNETLLREVALARHTEKLRRHFQALESLPSSAALGELLHRLEADFGRLAESDRIFKRLIDALPESERALFAAAATFPSASRAEVELIFLSRWARDHLMLTLGGDEALQQLASTDARRRRSRNQADRRAIESQLQSLEVERILHTLDQAPLLNVPERARNQRRSPEQAAREQILKECSKQRRLMPMRTFVRKFAPEGLLDILPVWLLSPETMAVLFPREAYFDLVLVDEASQCTVESGFPTLMRAKNFIVVGDEKQMPPSRFFQSSAEDDELMDEERAEKRELLGSESLLTLSRAICRHEGLKWHYRCKDESLIAFSNHAMYAGELLTIPASTPIELSRALRWVAVEGATYEKGRNTVEAERVVDLVDELLKRDSSPSIGVITFNIQQRRAILDAIDERLMADASFRNRWERANAAEQIDERPFVKNLESVQGDERDIIVFSLGHAPVARRRGGKETGEFYVPARFGPLGQRGGERRLNVAISRAKSECIIVSSFDPNLLNAGRAKHEGPRLFKEFLTFVFHTCAGDHELARSVLRRVSLAEHHGGESTRRARNVDDYVPLSAQIGLALEERGRRFAQEVGNSSFRIPLAISDAAEPSKYALAILTAEGRESRSVFESVVHFPSVLASRDWRAPEVSAVEWMLDREAILDELESLLVQ